MCMYVNVKATSIKLCVYFIVCVCTGNTKLVSLSDAVKLAVDGNLQIPGRIILTLKKYDKVESED